MHRVAVAGLGVAMAVSLAACSSSGKATGSSTTLNTACHDLLHANKALGTSIHTTTATPESLTAALKDFAKVLKQSEGDLPSSASSSVKALKRQLVVTRINLSGSSTSSFGEDLYKVRSDLKVIRKACKAQG